MFLNYNLIDATEPFTDTVEFKQYEDKIRNSLCSDSVNIDYGCWNLKNEIYTFQRSSLQKVSDHFLKMKLSMNDIKMEIIEIKSY